MRSWKRWDAIMSSNRALLVEGIVADTGAPLGHLTTCKGTINCDHCLNWKIINNDHRRKHSFSRYSLTTSSYSYVMEKFASRTILQEDRFNRGPKPSESLNVYLINPLFIWMQIFLPLASQIFSIFEAPQQIRGRWIWSELPGIRMP